MRPPLTALAAAEMLALDVWRAERSAESLGLAGLNSERAVRERLQKLRFELEASPHVSAVAREVLSALDFARSPTLTIRHRIEALLIALHPDPLSGPEALLLEPRTLPAAFAVRCYLVQAMGARLGWWSARGGEVRDSRIAKALYGELSAVRWTQYRGLIEASEELYRTSRWREAARSALEADRLVRTTASLLRASAALTKSGEFASALWCVRAALLEPRATFESLGVADRARALEARLRGLAEGAGAVGGASADPRELLEPIPLERRVEASAEDAKAGLLSVAGTRDLTRRRDPRRSPTAVEPSRRRVPAEPQLSPHLTPSARDLRPGDVRVFVSTMLAPARLAPPPAPPPEAEVASRAPRAEAIAPSEIAEESLEAFAIEPGAIDPFAIVADLEAGLALPRPALLRPAQRPPRASSEPSVRARAASDPATRPRAARTTRERSASTRAHEEEPTEAIVPRASRAAGAAGAAAHEETERIRDRAR